VGHLVETLWVRVLVQIPTKLAEPIGDALRHERLGVRPVALELVDHDLRDGKFTPLPVPEHAYRKDERLYRKIDSANWDQDCDHRPERPARLRNRRW
jgi:hypothetical protein